jgi:D-arabinose 5-phosphate isomerase GutQ
MGTEATAVSRLTMHYETDPVARSGFDLAVEAIVRSHRSRGKIVVAGVGKSGHIGRKLVAMSESLGIHASLLNPTEALHGDVGRVADNDVMLFITNSGSTKELLDLLPYIPASLPSVIMTAHIHPSSCKLIKQRPHTILLPAPLHVSEEAAFGVKAPTISTTLALTLGDALIYTVADEIYGNDLTNVFLRNHPGGAIGAAIEKPRQLADDVVPIIDMIEVHEMTTVTELMFSVFGSRGWARIGGDVIVPPRRLKKLGKYNRENSVEAVQGLTVPRHEWIQIRADRTMAEAKEWVTNMRQTVPGGSSTYSDDAIIVAMDEDEMIGVLEIGKVMNSGKD